VITWSAFLRPADKLAAFTPLVAKLFKTWPMPNPFNDPARAAETENYPRCTTDSLVSLLHYAGETEKRLGQLHCPICVMQAKKDSVTDPVSANVIYRDVSSTHREIHWLFESGHEMGADLENDKVFDLTCDYVLRFKKNNSR